MVSEIDAKSQGCARAGRVNRSHPGVPACRMKTRVGALGILIAFAQSGCAQPPPIAERAELGLVVLLPGVEGSGWQFDGTIAGLKDGGMNRPVEIIPWGTPPFQSLENLTNYGANLERAKRIAGRIVEYKGEHPDRPVTLVGYSGGGGLAIMAEIGRAHV